MILGFKIPYNMHHQPHPVAGFLFVGGWVDLRTERRKNMEVFGIMGFIFGLGALGKIIMLEKQLKESGVLKEQTESNDN